MTNDKVTMAQRNLDARFAKAGTLDVLQRPPKGWVKAIREALGMTAAQLGRRMGITQSAVAMLEHSEQLGRVRLDSLQRAAEALDCHVVYALVPNTPLEARVQTRRHEIAARRLFAIEQSMRLENQAVTDRKARERHLQNIYERINLRNLWDE